MITRLSLSIEIEEGTIFGEVIVGVSRWFDGKMMECAQAYKAPIVAQAIEESHSIYPWAVAVLRDASDNAVADMLAKFGRGEALLMHRSAFLEES